jgi:DNA repair photolyase
MISDCTDPYQPLESQTKLTRGCIRALVKQRFPVLVTTKSDLVTRDADLLTQTKAAVAMTITTLDAHTSRVIEPNAPPPNLRLSALKKLVRSGVPSIARIDPIIPFINDDWDAFEELVSQLGSAEVKQITVSTLKPISGFYEKMRTVNSSLEIKIRREYTAGKTILGYRYLPEEKRREIVQTSRRMVLRQGLDFASCREGFPELNTSVCDGSASLRSENKT